MLVSRLPQVPDSPHMVIVSVVRRPPVCPPARWDPPRRLFRPWSAAMPSRNQPAADRSPGRSRPLPGGAPVPPEGPHNRFVFVAAGTDFAAARGLRRANERAPSRAEPLLEPEPVDRRPARCPRNPMPRCWWRPTALLSFELLLWCEPQLLDQRGSWRRRRSRRVRLSTSGQAESHRVLRPAATYCGAAARCPRSGSIAQATEAGPLAPEGGAARANEAHRPARGVEVSPAESSLPALARHCARDCESARS
jgi:hypothetical protein